MNLIFCMCGCGEQSEEYNKWGYKRKYIHGHNGRGKPRSQEICYKISRSNLGKKKSPEHCRKNGESHKGMIAWNKGIPLSEEHIQHLRENHADFSKENHPNWSGGITPLNFQIRNSLKYSNWRTQIFGRDNFTCQECGVRGSWLEAHHKERFSKIMKDNNIKTLEEAYMCKELWNLDNGVTLCRKCHRKIKIIKINKGDLK